MPRPRFAAAIALLCMVFLAGCTPATPESAAAPAQLSPPTPSAAPLAPTTRPPTVTPTPTTFPANATIAGVPVAGLTLAEASDRVRAKLANLPALELRAGAARLSIAPTTIALTAPVDELLAEARSALAAGGAVAVPLRLRCDTVALRARLTALTVEVGSAATLTVLTTTDVLSRSFAYTPGQVLELDAAVKQISAALAAGQIEPLTLALGHSPTVPRVPLAQLRDEVVALTKRLPSGSVVGFHLTDLASGESIGVNDRTVFSGASTIKVAIMLNLYTKLAQFTEQQNLWLSAMIRDSDNLAANGLLAAIAGGEGTEYAFIGADQMSTLLETQLGLRHTYLYIPFEAIDYIKLYKPKFHCGPNGPVGAKPYTEMGACLRAEPASMASLYEMIDQCANGKGLLLTKFERLKPQRCQAMLDWLAQNDDQTRMVAGVPAGVRVEHKSGWIEDMQADTGIVRSPQGDYVLSIYYYRSLVPGRDQWTDEEMAPVVAAFSRLAYTAYNPVKVSGAGVQVSGRAH